MKKFICILLLSIACAATLNAQIRYLGTTNNTRSTQTQQHQQQYQQPQEQNASTTAYYKSGNGYVKLPIRVAIDQQGRIRIKQVYQQNVTGGQWQNVNSTSYAEKCRSMSYDDLESQFMYKCRIVSPTVTTVYFNL